MNTFIHNQFLLQNDIGQRLFHEVAAPLPIIDYHNHLDPVELAQNRKFDNLTQLWITPDPYKHRAMRIHGIPEAGITGDRPDWEKFTNWAKTFPRTLGNPLFHWSCLELKRIFEIDQLLGPQNVRQIWDQGHELLENDDFSTISILKKCQVEALSTSDDILANLSYHRKAREEYNIHITPSLRGDSILEVMRPGFSEWLESLSYQSHVQIHDLESYLEAIHTQLDSFEQAGCLFADHAFASDFQLHLPTYTEANKLFCKRLKESRLDAYEMGALMSFLLLYLGRQYARRKWVVQLHIGAQRQTSSRLRRLAGSAGGYAAIGSSVNIGNIASLLNTWELENSLSQIILYNHNPRDNEAFASLTGSFAEDGVAGKIQLGPAWWYNDYYEGIKNHLTVLANYGLLYHFIGMTTDSRTVLSFLRHEYFRRILCNVIGEWVEKGQVPSDWELLSDTVRSICYGNIKRLMTKKHDLHVKEQV